VLRLLFALFGYNQRTLFASTCSFFTWPPSWNKRWDSFTNYVQHVCSPRQNHCLK